MTTSAQHTPESAAPMQAAPRLDLRGSSYEDRRQIVAAVLDAITSTGCWIEEQRASGAAQMEFRFEAPLRAAVELYSALIAAGLEMTRESHLAMTGLCTLRRYHPRPPRRLRAVSIRLEVRFLESDWESEMAAVGLA